MANEQAKKHPAEEAAQQEDTLGQPAAPEIIEEETEDRPPLSRYLILQKIKPELISGYVLRKVGQAYMIMPTGPRMKDYQGMITLNETGAFLYEKLKALDNDPESFPKLVTACIEEYGATEEEAREAVDAFLGQCVECNLVAMEEVIVDRHTGLVITEDKIDQEYVKKEVEAQKAWFAAKEREMKAKQEEKEREQKAEG